MSKPPKVVREVPPVNAAGSEVAATPDDALAAKAVAVVDAVAISNNGKVEIINYGINRIGRRVNIKKGPK